MACFQNCILAFTSVYSQYPGKFQANYMYPLGENFSTAATRLVEFRRVSVEQQTYHSEEVLCKHVPVCYTVLQNTDNSGVVVPDNLLDPFLTPHCQCPAVVFEANM